MTPRKPPQIKSGDDFDEPVSVLVYGDPGCGKTPFGASCPKVLIITTEPGTISARRLGYKFDVWSAMEWGEFVKAYRWLKENPDHGYEWVVIDNATQLQEIMLRDIVATARAGNSKRDEDIPAIQDYQKWYLMFDRFVKSVNALPVPTMWLAHTMRRSNDEGEDIIIPSIQGQDFAQATKFCGRMLSIGYLEERLIERDGVKLRQRRILWRKDQHHFTKDRYIFQKDTSDGRYTIASENDVMKTDMAEISRRIHQAMEEILVKKTGSPRKATTAKKTVAKKAQARKAR